SQAAVYLCFALYAVFGRLLGHHGVNALRLTSETQRTVFGGVGIGCAALFGSITFFVVTNFASWVELTHLYPRTLDGLVTCYEPRLPWWRETMISDLVFPFVFLGLHVMWQHYVEPAPQPAEAPQS